MIFQKSRLVFNTLELEGTEYKISISRINTRRYYNMSVSRACGGRYEYASIARVKSYYFSSSYSRSACGLGLEMSRCIHE